MVTKRQLDEALIALHAIEAVVAVIRDPRVPKRYQTRGASFQATEAWQCMKLVCAYLQRVYDAERADGKEET